MSVFISYRRDGGEAMAQYIYEHLTRLGYDVFYDIESITKGNYKEVINKAVTNADDVIILLPRGSMDRCREEEDMVRFEISESLRLGKNIIPLVLRGFTFPEQMPDEIEEIRDIEQHDFTDMTNIRSRLEKLRRGLISMPGVRPGRKAFTNKDLILPASECRNGPQGGTYVRRGDLLDRIAATFREKADEGDGRENKHIVALSGLGGSGKSELAKAYADEHADEYYDIFLLTCTDGERPVFQDQMQVSYGDVTAEDLRDFGRETLIIIDNYNVDDTAYMNTLENGTGAADIIITTRLPQVGDHCIIPVESDDPEKFAFEVFLKNYTKVPARGKKKQVSSEEEVAVRSICRQVLYNTMLVAMLGIRLRQYSNLSIRECAERLKAGLPALPKGRIDYLKDDVKQTGELEGIVRFLFRDILSYEFSMDEGELVSILSLFPATWFDQDHILRLLGGADPYEHEYAANTLLDMGWLQGDGERIAIHPLIAEALRSEGCNQTGKKIVPNREAYERYLEHYLAFPEKDLEFQKWLINAIFQKADLPDTAFKLVVCLVLGRPDTIELLRLLYPDAHAAYLAYVDKSGRREYILVSLDDSGNTVRPEVLYECMSEDMGEDKAVLLRCTDDGTPFELDLQEPIEGVFVREIPAFFCFRNQDVTKIRLPETLKEIGKCAFSGCSGLSGELRLPENLTSLGKSAFYGCNRLSGELRVPERLTNIREYTFYGCSGLSGELHLPEGLTTIDRFAFYGCRGFSGELRLPESLTSIGEWAFKGCSGFSGELRLPESLTSIEESAFDGCSGLSGELHLPEGLISIEKSAFDGCSGLSGELHLPEKLTTIGEYAFFGCSGMSGELRLPESLTSIGKMAFSGCSGFNGELRLPENLISLENYAFLGCCGFTGELRLPESLTTIGEGAFKGCSGFNETPHLSENLTSIGDYAFDFLDSTGTTIYEIFNLPNPDVLGDKKETSGTLIEIPEDATIVEDFAFFDRSDIRGGLKLPESLTSIGESAFDGCSGLSGELRLPESLTNIGKSAFSYCSGFKGELHLPESLTNIGDKAFRGCSGFEGELKLPEGLMTIGSGAFEGCSGFEGGLKLPEGLTTIGWCAFKGCCGFGEELKLPESLATIGTGAFSGCSGFSGELRLPESLTIISGAFHGCSGLSGELHLPESLTTIDWYAFSGCSGFSGELRLPESLTTIGRCAFRGCSGFSGELRLPESLTTIGEKAFQGCSGFSGELKLPGSLTNIGRDAFDGCDQISRLIILNPEIEIIDIVDPRQLVIISGYRGSTAEKFAFQNNLIFEPLT